MEELIPSYLQALCQEIIYIGNQTNHLIPVHTIYFGGGTPSLLTIEKLDTVLQTLSISFKLLHDVEITMEANPGDLNLDYPKNLKKIGVNRLSIGAQSVHPEELVLLGRRHNYHDVIQSVKWVRQAGFTNLNLDLIFGLPEQPFSSWKKTLELITGISPDHLSIYSLSIEPGTKISRWIDKGLLRAPDPDMVADMYELAMEVLENKGWYQYEISNWCVSDGTTHLKTCLHNLQYWRNLPYIGIGAGSHGYAAGFRTENVNSPVQYVQKSKDVEQTYEFPITPYTLSYQSIDKENEIAETMMMGLRLVIEGVSHEAFLQRFGISMEDLFADKIARLIRLGLLEWGWHNHERCLRLTKKGRLLGNQVFVEFI